MTIAVAAALSNALRHDRCKSNLIYWSPFDTNAVFERMQAARLLQMAERSTNAFQEVPASDVPKIEPLSILARRLLRNAQNLKGIQR
jgi:hypothetical protein